MILRRAKRSAILSVSLALVMLLSGCSLAMSGPREARSATSLSVDVYVENAEREDGVLRLNAADDEVCIQIANTGDAAHPTTYGMLVFLDYKQADIRIDGESYRAYTYQPQALSPAVDPIRFSLDTDIDTDMNHKLLIVLVSDFDKNIADVDAKMRNPLTLALNYVLSFGEGKPMPAPEYDVAATQTLADRQLSGLLLSTQSRGQHVLSQDSMTVAPGEKFEMNFQINDLGIMENNVLSRGESALGLVILGKEQAVLTGQDYLICDVQDGVQQGTLTLQAPEAPGSYDVIPYAISDPFAPAIRFTYGVTPVQRFTLRVVAQ